MKNRPTKQIGLISEKIFFCSYSIYLIYNLLHASFFAAYIEGFGTPTMVICASMIICKELLRRTINKRDVFLLLICLLLGFVLTLHTNGYSMFPLPFFLYGARNISLRKIAKYTISISSFILILVFICAKLGIITDYIGNINGRTRDYIGFRYALFPAVILFNITALSVYIDKDNSLAKSALLLGVNYIIFAYTDSRLSFYLSIVLLVLAYVIKKWPSFTIERVKISRLIMVASYIICSALSIALIENYNSADYLMKKIDITLENRISLGNASLKTYPITLFGRDVEYVGSGLSINGKTHTKEYNYVDCLYLNMAEKYGLVFSLIYLAAMTYSAAKCNEKKQYILLLVLAVIAARGMIDDLGIFLHYNTFWFVISGNIISKKIKKGAK